MAFRVELLLLLAILVSLSFGSVDSDDGESFDPKALCLVCMPYFIFFFLNEAWISEQSFFFLSFKLNEPKCLILLLRGVSWVWKPGHHGT